MELPVSVNGRSAGEVAHVCAREAGRIIMAHFGRHEHMVAKGRGNFVTEADLEAERWVLDFLQQEYPGHGILSEETSSGIAASAPGWLWVVDPLDGTHNFSQGIPYFAFNIALCYDSRPVLALTYAPATNDEFFARKGAGLMVNGSLANVSKVDSVKESVLGIDLGYHDQRAAHLISLLADLWPGMQSVRVMGSAALGLAYAACGRYGLFVHHYLYPWDVAPGILLIQEGGGLIVDRDNRSVTIESQGIVGGAPSAVQDFLRLAADRPWR